MLDTAIPHPVSSRPPVGVSSAVLVNQCEPFAAATVMARRGQRQALAERVRTRFGIDLPSGPRYSRAGGFSILGLGPQTWLATDSREPQLLLRRLTDALGGTAAIVEQSDAYAVLQVSGPHSRTLLGKIVPIDVHQAAFHVGDVAATHASNVNVLLWREDDLPEGLARFSMAVFRSYLNSLLHSLSQAGVEFGLTCPEERSRADPDR